MPRTVAITTIDNPFDPIDQFREWFMFDTSNGYNTCAYLARVAKTSEMLPDETNDAETERAIDEIVKNDPLRIYKKVVHT